MVSTVGSDQGPPPDGRLLAVLVDADNTQPSLLGPILAELATYGEAVVRRIYGDWTNNRMGQWKQQIQQHAVDPRQQFTYAAGKNSTDMALAIEAMDLLHAGHLDGFCIVSSDSDFTRLARRIHEQGLLVVGVGRRDTPKAFVNSCGVFVYVENLTPSDRTAAEPAQRTEPDDDWTEIATAAVVAACADDSWAQLGQVGTLIRQRDPGFDPRSYGMAGRRLSLLLKSRPDLFELSGDAEGGGPMRARLAGGRT